ncbi:hypothetical protein NST99_01470 [Paenibacillus sp. FSL L8-0470]|uniref:hypothetical protein n=1 Tax=Paenibacillus sp. FSL L8-0470 TaxID=2954688 RepID=UPI0030FD0D62
MRSWQTSRVGQGAAGIDALRSELLSGLWFACVPRHEETRDTRHSVLRNTAGAHSVLRNITSAALCAA